MKRILTAALALTLMSGTAVMAQTSDHGNQGNAHSKQDSKDQKRGDKGDKGDKGHDNTAPTAPVSPAPVMPTVHSGPVVRDHTQPPPPPVVQASPFFQNRPNVRASTPRFTRGDRLPTQYRQNPQYSVGDWQQRGLRKPTRGYHWVRDDNNNFFLTAIATGLIATTVYRNDRDQNWDKRYSRTYSYNDDVYYRECRNQPDPGGVIVGAIIGGLLGNAASHGGGGAIAGIILGGTVGAALTSNMDCEDRSYAYRSYYDGFNSGRPGSHYDWRNPRNDHHGEFRVGSYYNDPYGFRCARFTQTTYIQGRSYDARGVACRQPDGSWAVVN